MLYQRRHVIDDSLRALLASKPNVEVRWSSRVKRLGNGPAVELANGSVLTADFVVDASGRHSKLCADYTSSCSETVIDLQYVSLEFDVANDDDDDARFGIAVFPKAGQPRGAAVMRLQGNRVLATVFGYQEGRPRNVNTADDFIAFARTAPQDDVATFLRNATAVGKPHTFVYDKMTQRSFKYMPDHCIAIGDAACSTDPCFAQGMSKAAVQALYVKRAFDNKGTCRQSDFEHVADVPYFLGSVEAYRHLPSTVVPRVIKPVLGAFDMAFYAASRDAVVYDELMRVLHMRKHIGWLVLQLPRIVYRCVMG